MTLDPTLANLLSKVSLDIAKAFLIAGIVTPQFASATPLEELLVILIKALLNFILFLWISWFFAKIKQ